MNNLSRIRDIRPRVKYMMSRIRDNRPMSVNFILFIFYFLIRCNSQTTQATELTQTRLQIAPSILITFHIKKDTTRMTRVSRNSDSIAIETVQMILNSAH